MASEHGTLRLDLATDPANIAEARHAVGAFAADAGADHFAVRLAVSEAVTNALVHGYPDDPTGRVTVSAYVEADAFVVEVRDDGGGMRPNPESKGLGIGLPLIGHFSSNVEIENHSEGGTIITMRFALPGKENG
jgi:anti-sigma regulatory factor (Ser/Thr protein kinase)